MPTTTTVKPEGLAKRRLLANAHDGPERASADGLDHPVLPVDDEILAGDHYGLGGHGGVARGEGQREGGLTEWTKNKTKNERANSSEMCSVDLSPSHGF
jgi:hypothetical protein